MADTGQVTAQPGRLGWLAGPFRRARGLIHAITRHNQRRQRLDRLNRLSDAQLAARGLSREDLARHCFRSVAPG